MEAGTGFEEQGLGGGLQFAVHFDFSGWYTAVSGKTFLTEPCFLAVGRQLDLFLDMSYVERCVCLTICFRNSVEQHTEIDAFDQRCAETSLVTADRLK